MTTEEVFSTGDSESKGDAARQAVHALRGYAYQVVSATLEWLHLADDGYLILEVAEDFAIMADGILQSVQVKDTARSGSVTLVSQSVIKAIESFVTLANSYADRQIEFLFLTTSEIGTERAKRGASSRYAWSTVLEEGKRAGLHAKRSNRFGRFYRAIHFRNGVRTFCSERNNHELHRDLITRIKWECGRGDLESIRDELEAGLVLLGRHKFSIPAPAARRLADPLIYEVLKRSTNDAAKNRVLSRADLYSAIDADTQVSVLVLRWSR